MKPVTITPFTVGHLRFDLSTIYRLPPQHDYAGRTADVPMQSYHIALPGRSLLVDAVDYDPREISASLAIAGYRPPPPLLQQLREGGIDAAQITDVIITHLHFDHFGALATGEEAPYRPAFPRARHYVNTADWQPQDFDDLERRTLLTVQRAGLLRLVESMVDLGDGLAIVPLPGETPGHQMLRLRTAGGARYFAGDLYHHEVEIVDPSTDVYWADRETMRRSKGGLWQQAVANSGLAYFTHIAGPFRAVDGGGGLPAWEKAE